MKELLLKAIAYIKVYKWLLLPLVPAVLLLVLVVFLIFLPPKTELKPEEVYSTPTPEPIPLSEVGGKEYDDPQALLPDYLKEQSVSEGTAYSFKSGNPSRPSIVITSKDGFVTFTRRVASSDYKPATLSLFKQAYGDPEKIVNGSKFYGPNTVIYIFSGIGVAAIGNPDTGEVYEEQFFQLMSPEEYLQKYDN